MIQRVRKAKGKGKYAGKRLFLFVFSEKINFFEKKMKLGIVKIKLCGKHMYDFRIVVQPGRTLRSGRRGRWFESSQSDHKKSHLCGGFFYGQTGAD